MVLHRAPPSRVRAVRQVSVPFSKGMVLHLRFAGPDRDYRSRFSPLLEGDGLASLDTFDCHANSFRFQSPSRRGWSCIVSGSGILSSTANVSVPFSKGMVLHRAGNAEVRRMVASFSPLLEGDGLASLPPNRKNVRVFGFQSPSRRGWSCIERGLYDGGTRPGRFSPLLEGDGLASPKRRRISSMNPSFQSPSRRGWSCISMAETPTGEVCLVSVPFSKGMVLHHDVGGLRPRHLHGFQSPSRRGWSCIVAVCGGTLRRF